MVSEPYTLRALTLYNSFRQKSADNYFAIYCIDDAAACLLESIQDDFLLVFSPADYKPPELLSLKDSRAFNEYCWTHKPFILEHAMQQFPDIEWVVYLDSDMMAFGDPDEALPTDQDKNAVLTPHRPSNDHFAKFIPTAGYFNAGYAGFRNTEIGRAALHWWREKCIEYCPSIPTNGAYADQKYLDQLVDDFPGVICSQSAGLNAGPWNILSGKLSLKHDRVFVNEDPLLLYHMQGFKIFGTHLFDVYPGPVKMTKSIRHLIYRPYETLIAATWEVLAGANARVPKIADAPFWKFVPLLREIKKLLNATSNLSIRF